MSSTAMVVQYVINAEEVKEFKDMLSKVLDKLSRTEKKNTPWMTIDEACAYAKISKTDFNRKKKLPDFPFEIGSLGGPSVRYRPKEGF